MGQDNEEKTKWSIMGNESNLVEHLWISRPIAANDTLIGLIYLIEIRKLLPENTFIHQC